MKKLVLIVAIVAFSTLMSASMASAQNNGRGSIEGTYEMISSGICLHSTCGFDTNLTPIKTPNPNCTEGDPPVTVAPQVWSGTATAQATWIFEHNGTGTVAGTNYASTFPGGDRPVYVNKSTFGFNFTYEIVDGYITVYGSGLKMEGMVSIDKKSITLLSANQVQDLRKFKLGYLINNNARVMIKVGN